MFRMYVLHFIWYLAIVTFDINSNASKYYHSGVCITICMSLWLLDVGLKSC